MGVLDNRIIQITILFGVGGVVLMALIYPLPTHTPNDNINTINYQNATEVRESSAIIVDGEVYVSRTVAANPRATKVKTIRNGEGGRAVVVQYNEQSNSGYFKRSTFYNSEQAADIWDGIKRDPNRTILSKQQLDNRTVFTIYEREKFELSKPILVLSNLEFASYQTRKSQESTDKQVLEPKSGFYDGFREYYLGNTRGRIEIDSQTHRLYSANITWKYVPETRTILDYLIYRNNRFIFQIRYSLTEGNVTVNTPSWVVKAQSNKTVQERELS